MLTLEDRFWSKADKSGGPNACWVWAACADKAGYGVFWDGGKRVLAHRFAYELEHGPIPDGLHACHKCDHPGCVNPNHIFLGTAADNAADREAKGRGNPARGERSGMAKLTEARVAEIRAAYAAGGVTYVKLGRRFGVSKATIGSVVRGDLWEDGCLGS